MVALLTLLLGCATSLEGTPCDWDGAKQCDEEDTPFECVDGAWAAVELWPGCACFDGEVLCG